jgi:hypothetical protein
MAYRDVSSASPDAPQLLQIVSVRANQTDLPRQHVRESRWTYRNVSSASPDTPQLLQIVSVRAEQTGLPRQHVRDSRWTYRNVSSASPDTPRLLQMVSVRAVSQIALDYVSVPASLAVRGGIVCRVFVTKGGYE